MRQVLLLGATGLVGGQLLPLLLVDDSIERVVVVSRRPTGSLHRKLDEHVLELGSMESHSFLFEVDQIFCALGTTIKQAGSQEQFRATDHDLPLTAARLGLSKGARHFLLVSALGASASSRVFYNRVKGELEDDLRSLHYPALTIVRPSLLVGPRKQKRLGEEVGRALGFLLPRKYSPIHAATVARALEEFAIEDQDSVRIVESEEMNRRFERRRQLRKEEE
jgi:uncharacterized protein YbjT (DUF2867 family)